MAEIDEEKSGSPSLDTNAAALNAAFDIAGGSAEARDFLRKQSRLAELQIDNLEKQDEFELSHLRFRRFSDYARFALEAVAACVVLAIGVAICGAVWSAAHDNSLVIEAFSVPPDLANRGLTGQAVAAQLQDKLAAMQNATDSARPPSSYANNWGSDIKVQIPDTGVSVGEFYRLLTAALGHQTHITGEVYRTAKGIAITARTGGDGGSTASGAEADFDSVVQQMAEAIYRRTQPYRYGVYVEYQGKFAESRAVYESLTQADSSPRERAWAYVGISVLDAIQGDGVGSVEFQRKAVAIIPDFAVAWSNLDGYNGNLGHDEAALAAERVLLPILRGNGNVDMTERSRTATAAGEQANLDYYTCDFEASLKGYAATTQEPDYGGSVENAREAIPPVLALLHEPSAAMGAWYAFPPDRDLGDLYGRAISRFTLAYFTGDWSGVLSLQNDVRATYDAAAKARVMIGVALSIIEPTQIRPAVAYALAEKGDFRGAHAAIDRTPTDCVFCLRMRAGIDALERNWTGANYWYGRAAEFAPSIPFVDSDWGRMLLAKGDFEGAIAKFEIANRKGPHFADPLEMWGETLIGENRSDLALAKFTEADKYAPNWGRLHLKWGEALLWSGDKAGALKQFATAASLDLSPSEKTELVRMRGTRG
jgi:tetratricopeptide (TPR) repeat protein